MPHYVLKLGVNLYHLTDFAGRVIAFTLWLLQTLLTQFTLFMKNRLLLTIFFAFFSHSTFASLDGSWEGVEYTFENVKLGSSRLPTFLVPGLNTVDVDDASKTITVTNSLGAFNGVYAEKIISKSGIVIKRNFNAKFDKTELAFLVNARLVFGFGSDFIISEVKVISANGKGSEFNEPYLSENSHVIRGNIKIKANFKIAQITEPNKKLSASTTLDIDFFETRSLAPLAQTQSAPQPASSLYVKSAKKIKSLFKEQARP